MYYLLEILFLRCAKWQESRCRSSAAPTSGDVEGRRWGAVYLDDLAANDKFGSVHPLVHRDLIVRGELTRANVNLPALLHLKCSLDTLLSRLTFNA